jgi:hypothetical protein
MAITYRQRLKRLAMIVTVLGVVAATVIYLRHRPLLLRDSTSNVTYSVAGKSHQDGAIFRSMLSSPVRFIHLPSAPPELQWFGYVPGDKAIGQGPLVRKGVFGWNTTHPPVIGIQLGDPKLEANAPAVVPGVVFCDDW